MAKLKELKDNDELLNERGRNDGTNAFQRFKKVTKESVIDSPLTSSIERETDTKSTITFESNDESDTPTSINSEKEATITPKSETKKVKFANELTSTGVTTNKEIKKPKSKEELTPKEETTTTAVSTEWSTDQQKQLETALKKYPANASDTERWDKISAAVTGKSKQECVARFKEIREAILKKKASGTS